MWVALTRKLSSETRAEVLEALVETQGAALSAPQARQPVPVGSFGSLETDVARPINHRGHTTAFAQKGAAPTPESMRSGRDTQLRGPG